MCQKSPGMRNIPGRYDSLRGVRQIAIFVCAFATVSYGQDVEGAYQQIELSLRQTQSAARVFMEATGWTKDGSTSTAYEVRIWRESRNEPDTFPDRLFVEGYVDGALRLVIVADGKLVWRYDPIRKEYTFLSQGGGPADAIATAVAWVRQEGQRPLRLFIPRNYRWLTRPDGTVTPYGAEIRQVMPYGGDWRGTYLHWYFTPAQALDRLVIHEKFELTPGTLTESYMDVRLIYPSSPFTFAFRPSIPSDAKPAQDLPRRIGS